MRHGRIAGALAISLLTSLGLGSAAPSASLLARDFRVVRGGITYPCRVEYQDGFFTELCYVDLTSYTEPVVNEISNDKGPKSDPAWSPDGTRLAFVREGGIYVSNVWRFAGCAVEGPCHNGIGKARRIASGGEPDWSPDGTKIAFVTRQGGNADIAVVAERGGTARRLTHNPADDVEPAWSPNGRTVAFTRGAEVRLVNSDGSNDRPFGAGGGAAWSPSGQRVAFEYAGDIWLANANGSGRMNLTQTPDVHETSPSWLGSADGRALAFAGRDSNGVDAVYIRRLSGGSQRVELSTDQERPFTQAVVDWQSIRVLVASVSDRKPIVSFRDARGHQLTTIRAGYYAFAYVDRSKHHGITFSTGPVSDLTVPYVGRRWPRVVPRDGVATLRPGIYRYWDPANPHRYRGSFRVVDQP